MIDKKIFRTAQTNTSVVCVAGQCLEGLANVTSSSARTSFEHEDIN